MAIRYSGDVEVRMQYGGAGYRDPKNKRGVFFDPRGEGFYFASIRAPGIRNVAILSEREIGLPKWSLSRKLPPAAGQAPSSEQYDMVAEAFLKWAEIYVGELPVELDNHNQIVVRRVFQSPCPTRPG